jgi:hypothetical protein
MTPTSRSHPTHVEAASHNTVPCAASTTGSRCVTPAAPPGQGCRLGEWSACALWVWASGAASGARAMRWDWPHIVTEAITVVVCAPLALVVMVAVADDDWPSWWLVVAGVLAAWAGDSVGNLGFHIADVLRARRWYRTRADGAQGRGTDGDAGGRR